MGAADIFGILAIDCIFDKLRRRATGMISADEGHDLQHND